MTLTEPCGTKPFKCRLSWCNYTNTCIRVNPPVIEPPGPFDYHYIKEIHAVSLLKEDCLLNKLRILIKNYIFLYKNKRITLKEIRDDLFYFIMTIEENKK